MSRSSEIGEVVRLIGVPAAAAGCPETNRIPATIMPDNAKTNTGTRHLINIHYSLKSDLIEC
jgi:hypothetical protein